MSAWPSWTRPSDRRCPVSGDRLARVADWADRVAVAVFAAIVSFSHIESLALRARRARLAAARLLPLSVDGLILAASLVLLTRRAHHRAAPRLARPGWRSGSSPRCVANVAYGAGYGVVGRGHHAWPAVVVHHLYGDPGRPDAPRRWYTLPRGSFRDSGGHRARGQACDRAQCRTRGRARNCACGRAWGWCTPRARDTVPRTVSAGRARGRARKQAPDHAFAAESHGASCQASGRSRPSCTLAPIAPAPSVTSLKRSCRKRLRQRNRAHGIAPA